MKRRSKALVLISAALVTMALLAYLNLDAAQEGGARTPGLSAPANPLGDKTSAQDVPDNGPEERA
ncbi:MULTISPECIES: hypothetical protein [unclassified Streptomyces]|uniref:hypothetical protein n=1 Tax=unclassified Streptomyces TaxID=2593676 RepID=UPI0016561D1A|nr:hypothetical protein [Streptomyces sp. CB02980]MCB8902057.1 hypothetical protein [Streptomyces sp. CB02980]